MSFTWETIWTFKTKRFTVILDCTPEDQPDYSWDDDGEAQRKCEAGIWQCVIFRVRVLLDGEEIAQDTLGNSIYERVADFRKEHIGSRGGAYFKDMVSESIREARRIIRSSVRPYIRANA